MGGDAGDFFSFFLVGGGLGELRGGDVLAAAVLINLDSRSNCSRLQVQTNILTFTQSFCFLLKIILE